jgi:hypothetical protein
VISFELPFRIESQNVGLRTSIKSLGAMRRRRFAQRRKVKAQRHAAALVLLAKASPGVRRQLLAAERLVITLTRVAPGTLDEDNLLAGFKATRDGIADGLKLDDRDPRLRWLYDQVRDGPKRYGARVHLEGIAAEAFAQRLAARERAA